MIRLIFQKMCILNHFYHFYFLNIDISVAIKVFDLKFSVCVLGIVFEGSMSQIFYLGLSFYFMSKNG